MKKIIYSLPLCLATLLLTSCLKQEFEKKVAEYEESQIGENMKTVFGVTFNPQHDWSSTSSGTITITADADLDDIVKVQILTCSPFGGADANGSTILNEVRAAKGQVVTLAYDAPTYRERLYAACVSSDGTYRIKGFTHAETTALSFANAATRADIGSATRALPETVKLGRHEASYNARRTADSSNSSFAIWSGSGWENDHLYQLLDQDEGPQRIFVDDYTDDEKADILDIVFTYLPNTVWNGGKRYNDNRQKIIDSDILRLENNYITTNGRDIVTLAPIYRQAGNEINNCHIYYYYFRPEQIAGMSEAEQIQFFKDLPKYKAIQLYRTLRDGNLPNGVVRKTQEYPLVFWGDDVPTVGQTMGSYTFPAGYKIGLMMRSIQSGALDNVNNGCLYGDGRLNTEINCWGNFANALLEPTDPRFAVFGANGKTYYCFEDGTDQDYNDLILEINSGIEPIDEKPTPSTNVYTFCFEDRLLSDYDMNDVVLQAERIDQTHIKLRLVACGADDELYLRNLNGSRLNESTEIHTLLNSRDRFINALSTTEHTPGVEETFTVDPSFSFTDLHGLFYIYNKTKNRVITLSESGEDPHGICIPCDFKWPLEGVCIKDAYPDFNNWGQNPVTSTDWYLYPADGKVYTKNATR